MSSGKNDIDEFIENCEKEEKSIVKETKYDEITTRGGQPISLAEKAFVNLIVNGYNQTEAYKKIFPNRSKGVSRANLGLRAHTLANKPRVAKQIYLARQYYAKMSEDAGQWSREESIRHLRDLVTKSELEHERINLGQDIELDILNMESSVIEKEINDINEELKKETNESKKKTLEKELLQLEQKQLRQLKKLSQTLKTKGLGQNTVKAITESIKIINDMQGYTGDNIKMSETIVFRKAKEGESEVYE